MMTNSALATRKAPQYGFYMMIIYVLGHEMISSFIGRNLSPVLTKLGIIGLLNSFLTTEATGETVSLVGFFGVSMLLTFAWSKWATGRSMASLGYRKPVVVPYLTGFAIGSIFLLSTVLIPALLGQVQFYGFNKDMILLHTLIFLVGYMIQGMSEEVFCRGLIMNAFAGKFGMWAGVLANSIIFSLLHLGNNGSDFWPLFNLFLAGIFYSLLFWYTDNLWLVGAAHTAWNFVQGPFLGLPVSGFPAIDPVFKGDTQGHVLISGGEFGIEGSLVCTLISILAIAILVKLLMDKSKQEKIA